MVWELYRSDNILHLVDVNDKSNIIDMKRDNFENLLQKNSIFILDNYTPKNKTSSLSYLELAEYISSKNREKIEILKKYIKFNGGCKKNDFCNYMKKEYNVNLSKITIYRLITAFERNGKTMSFLLPKKQKRKNRIEQPIQEIIINCIKNNYATPERINIRNLYDLIKIQLHKFNIARKEFPSYQTICNYVNKYNEELQIEKKRLGSKEHYKRFGAVFNGVQTTYPLERVEIDHTFIDLKVYVYDEYGKKNFLVGRPVLTVIKDHFTKSFLGYHLTFDAPNTEISLKCLKHAMQRKVKKYPEIDDDWIQYGRIKEIVADNASEFKSNKFEQVCYNLGINLVYSASYEPWLKGTVESAFHSLNSLLDRLPSKIRKDIIIGQKFEETIISFENLDFILNLWIIMDYHNKYNEKKKNTPNNLWKENIRNESALDNELENINFDQMDVEKFDRNLSRKGINFKTLRYNSTELNSLFMRNKKINNTIIKVNILANSDDISYIYVFDKENSNYLKVNNIDGIPESYSMKDLKLRNRKQNEFKHTINRKHDEKLLEVNKIVNSVIDKNKYDQKTLRKKKISSDNTKIIPPIKVDHNNSYDSIYDDGGLFDVEN